MAKANKAFTVVEMIVVVIIMGAITAAAIVQYNSAVQRAVERDAALRLRAIVGAIHIYHNQNGSWPPAMNNLAAINATLGTNFLNTDNLTFKCESLYAGNVYDCQAYSIYGWSLQVESNYMKGVPHCLSDFQGGASCPTCDQTGCF